MSRDVPGAESSAEAAMRDCAAAWVVRQDRRLTPVERAELEAWLQADPRHADAFARSATAWRTFRRMGAEVQRSAPAAARTAHSVRRRTQVIGGLAAAAAIALLFFGVRRDREERGRTGDVAAEAKAVASATGGNVRVLVDGSLVRLNDGAEIEDVFTATERRVRLRRGEAYFSVTKDPARPFLVEAGSVTVRAVGTAFVVQRGADAVDVVVTEGTVRVAAPRENEPEPATTARVALVEAGHRAVVRPGEAEAASIAVTSLTSERMAERLAWQQGLLSFGGATLRDVAASFAHYSGQPITIADPALAELRIGGQFPPRDVDGFLRVLHELHGVKATRQMDGTVTLSR